MEYYGFIFGIIDIFVTYNCQTSAAHQSPLVKGMDDTMQAFGTCNIRVTAEFRKIDWEPVAVPIVLCDTKYSANPKHFLISIWPTYYSLARAKLGGMFKYRGSICAMDMILYVPYTIEMYYYVTTYQRDEYMSDKYLVFVQLHAAFLAETPRNVWPGLSYYIDHRILVWTIIPKSDALGSSLQTNQFVFIDIFYITQSWKNEMYEEEKQVFRFPIEAAARSTFISKTN